MPDSKPRGALIEIVEKRPTAEESTYSDVIISDEVRINGQPLLCPADYPVKVHEVEIRDRDAVLVTLTVFARRVVIGAEVEAVNGDA